MEGKGLPRDTVFHQSLRNTNFFEFENIKLLWNETNEGKYGSINSLWNNLQNFVEQIITNDKVYIKSIDFILDQEACKSKGEKIIRVSIKILLHYY